ncbi:unnamed protein product [Oncorhynchus mykiss]|uniref:Uncharacterized protein n=1 Tax=Oncorhynchus mykiss TaxID=8022 RepID=A0A061AFQ3_ONCMY|nr:unnamed protein product [Oncorhynchus mykiss]
MEGCFCPEGTILFNTFSDTCVRDCGCTGPDGKPKQVIMWMYITMNLSEEMVQQLTSHYGPQKGSV